MSSESTQFKPGHPNLHKPTEESDPLMRAKVIDAYAETGGNRKQTAALVGVSVDTVRRIFARNPEDFQLANKLAAREFASDADKLRTQTMANAGELNAYQSGILACAFTDKHLALQQRISPGGLDVNELRTLKKVLEDAERRATETVIDVTAEEVQNAEVSGEEVEEGIRSQEQNTVHDNEQNGGDARLEDHTEGETDGNEAPGRDVPARQETGSPSP